MAPNSNSNPTPPNHSTSLQVTFPIDHVLLLTFNRPKSLNAMTPQLSEDLRVVLDWFEDEDCLWVVIMTGAGRLFCAGADLKAWNETQQQSGQIHEQTELTTTLTNNIHGFGSISRRQSKKPMIAAVSGEGAYGGGVEMILNCDYVVACKEAKFGLPEVRRGVVAVQGGIPRLSQIAGHQLAAEMVLLGRTISAEEAQGRFGFVNTIVSNNSQVLPKALAIAQQIIQNSPDAVQSTKRGLLLSQQFGHDEMFFKHVWSEESKRVYRGWNIKEGLKAFSEKRSPVWKNPSSKL